MKNLAKLHGSRSLLPVLLGLLSAAFLLSGCSQTFWTSTVSKTKTIHTGDVLLSTADLRVVTRTARGGQVVTCAEPSPDVAKIASASFDGSLAASASSVGSVANPEIAAAIAASRAEGLAQLGQRLATIQLLRDGLYRACEGYANGAINEKIYATILSRYDDVMITMLLGEFAAAKQSSLPAILTGSAKASGTAFTGPSDELKEQLQKIETAKGEKATTDQQIAGKEAEIKNAPAGSDTSTAQGELASMKATSAQQGENVAQLEEQAAAMSIAFAQAQAEAETKSPSQTGGSGGSGSDGGVAAAALYGMQRNYLDDFNLDALFVGCLADNDPGKNQICSTLISNPELMKRIATLKTIDVVLRDLRGDAGRLGEVQKILQEVEEIERRMSATPSTNSMPAAPLNISPQGAPITPQG